MTRWVNVFSRVFPLLNFFLSLSTPRDHSKGSFPQFVEEFLLNSNTSKYINKRKSIKVKLLIADKKQISPKITVSAQQKWLPPTPPKQRRNECLGANYDIILRALRVEK